MLVQGQKVQIKITNSNKPWYESKGYSNVNKGEMLLVNIEDLTPGLHIKVKVRCDYCGKVVDVVWRDYVKRSNSKNACKNCRLKKVLIKFIRITDKMLPM